MIMAAVVQLRTPDNPRDALAHARSWVLRAVDAGGRLIVTPETSNFMVRPAEAARLAAVPEDDDVVVNGLREVAAARGIWVLIGSAIVRAEDGRIANRSLLIDDGGRIVARYDKIHLFEADIPGGERYRESDTCAPGRVAVVADTSWGGVGLTICYDLRFPELHRDLAMAGAAIIAVPAAFTRPTGEAHWEVLLRARAIETGAYILAAAQGGRHRDGTATWGRSMIVAPWGEVIARVRGDAPGVAIASIDMDRVTAARAAVPSLANRRAYEAPLRREGIELVM